MINFILRPWAESDVESVARYANNALIAANLRDGFVNPYTQADARVFVFSCLSAPPEQQYARAIEIEGEAAGSIAVFIGSDVYKKSAEVGYWLAQPYWGGGVMSKAISLICKEVFAQYDVVRIEAEPFATNTGSRRALEKAGFTLEGVKRQSVFKLGRLVDSCVYSLLKSELQ